MRTSSSFGTGTPIWSGFRAPGPPGEVTAMAVIARGSVVIRDSLVDRTQSESFIQDCRAGLELIKDRKVMRVTGQTCNLGEPAPNCRWFSHRQGAGPWTSTTFV